MSKLTLHIAPLTQTVTRLKHTINDSINYLADFKNKYKLPLEKGTPEITVILIAILQLIRNALTKDDEYFAFDIFLRILLTVDDPHFINCLEWAIIAHWTPKYGSVLDCIPICANAVIYCLFLIDKSNLYKNDKEAYNRALYYIEKLLVCKTIEEGEKLH